VSNAVAVVRGIANYEGDEAVKDFLRAMFNWELANASLKNPQFKAAYVREIEARVLEWETRHQGGIQ
jgi:hypothetical protein